MWGKGLRAGNRRSVKGGNRVSGIEDRKMNREEADKTSENQVYRFWLIAVSGQGWILGHARQRLVHLNPGLR